MKPSSFAMFATALSLSALAGAPLMAQNRIFYVDYDQGNDKADGLSTATAWKHAPGDSQSTGASRTLKLLPGDQVRFKGGVRYRSTIMPRTEGTEANPVIFEGSAWGAERAIFDGSEPLSGVRPCNSAADCLGSPYWQNLWRASVPASARWTDYLFINDQIFQLAQYPPLQKNEMDDSHLYLPIPKADLQRLQAGQIRSELPAGLDRGTPVLALWVQPNLIALTPDIHVGTTGVDFAGAAWVNATFKPYTDRDNRFSLLNLPAMVNRAGLFAMSPKDGVAIFWPIPAGAKAVGGKMPTPVASIGSGRIALNTGNATNFVVHGFSFTSFAGVPGSQGKGSAIRASGSNPGVRISGNIFRSIANIGGPPVINALFSRNLVIENNQMTDTPWTRGISVTNSIGPVMIRCNQLSEIGHTGIRFLNVKDGQILGNTLNKVQSRHGNGITAYLDLRNVRISGNVVTDASRPLTVEGVLASGSPYFDEGIQSVTVTDNVLMGGDGVNGAITSYNNTPNLTIRNNFLYSIPNAIKISGKEEGFSASGNQLVGKVAQPKATPLVTADSYVQHDPEGNGALLVRQMQRAKPPAGYCS